ncbi:uncharacterized protein ARMOST_04358 [Armillaria ostoyae]|uniref:F-box domain-containing protein n=1 Tax=Armillaria ostoyae TaxID=47428 RepID=A0A284QX94_ARMOS|nr:uncharacterized protein ARMOST_04358 [Armillaria ostoyae]
MLLRRSARTAVPSKRRSLADPEPDGVQYEDEDSERERGVEMDAGGAKHSPVKRRRTTTTATKQTKATKTERNRIEKKRDLNLLPKMPLDILFIIFGMLSARDLINLTRVDESFCRTLTLPDVSFVWKGARDAEEGIEPPRGIPEYRWANLFFGGPVCDFCQAKKVYVDWMLRRRVCKRCLKLICASTVARRFPDVNDNILSLIPLTYAGPRKERARSGYHWISDIIDIQAKLKKLEAQPERLTEFQTERKELVEDINRDARRCREWARAYARKIACESGRRKSNM